MLKQYKDLSTAMRRHSIEPSVFVVSVDHDARPNIMACGWNAKLSYDPPLIGIALKKAGYSGKLITATKEFVVAVPTPQMEKQLLYAGSISGADEDKLSKVGFRTQVATAVSVPILTDARANYECKLQQIVEVGDHYLYVGEIVAAYYDSAQDQLFFAGRHPDNTKRFESVKTTFPGE